MTQNKRRSRRRRRHSGASMSKNRFEMLTLEEWREVNHYSCVFSRAREDVIVVVVSVAS